MTTILLTHHATSMNYCTTIYSENSIIVTLYKQYTLNFLFKMHIFLHCSHYSKIIHKYVNLYTAPEVHSWIWEIIQVLTIKQMVPVHISEEAVLLDLIKAQSVGCVAAQLSD